MAAEYEGVLRAELDRQRARLASAPAEERTRLEKLVSLLERQLGLPPTSAPATGAQKAAVRPQSIPFPGVSALAAAAPPPPSRPAPSDPARGVAAPSIASLSPDATASAPAAGGSELRKFVRLPFATVVRMRRDNNEEVNTIGRNLSTTGVGVGSEFFVMPGTRAAVHFDSPFGPIDGACTVRWCQRLSLDAGYDFEVGMEYTEISPHDADRLRLWIAKLGG